MPGPPSSQFKGNAKMPLTNRNRCRMPIVNEELSEFYLAIFDDPNIPWMGKTKGLCAGIGTLAIRRFSFLFLMVWLPSLLRVFTDHKPRSRRRHSGRRPARRKPQASANIGLGWSTGLTGWCLAPPWRALAVPRLRPMPASLPPMPLPSPLPFLHPGLCRVA